MPSSASRSISGSSPAHPIAVEADAEVEGGGNGGRGPTAQGGREREETPPRGEIVVGEVEVSEQEGVRAGGGRGGARDGVGEGVVRLRSRWVREGEADRPGWRAGVEGEGQEGGGEGEGGEGGGVEEEAGEGVRRHPLMHAQQRRVVVHAAGGRRRSGRWREDSRVERGGEGRTGRRGRGGR